MAIISKLAPNLTLIGRTSLGKLRPNQIIVCSVRNGGHGHIYRKREGQMYWNRIKDVIHFYFIGIGFLPFFIALGYAHIVYGACELQDYPEDGPPPHFWQYERTPFKQWWTKWFQLSDMEHHERNLSLMERGGILNRWRRMEARVKHLQGERWDYKGYFYQPVSASWIDQSRYYAEKFHYQYEIYGHKDI